MYPLLVENGSLIRQELQKSKIFIPKLWPDFSKDKIVSDQKERLLADNILPLPCDQRYNVDDMIYMISIIKKYVNM